MIYREAISYNTLGKPLPPKVAHRGNASIKVAQGNHNVSGFAEPLRIDGEIDILHFPLRSKEQFINKIVKGGAAYERNSELKKGIGRTWRELYEQFQQDKLKSFFDEHCTTLDRIRNDLMTGKLKKDNRLSEYMNSLL